MLKKTLLVIAVLSMFALPALAGHKKFPHDWPTGTMTVTTATTITTKDWLDLCWDINVVMDIEFVICLTNQGDIEIFQIHEDRDGDGHTYMPPLYSFEGCRVYGVVSNCTFDLKATISSTNAVAAAKWYVKLLDQCPTSPLGDGPTSDTKCGIGHGDDIAIVAGCDKANILLNQACQTNVHVATIDLQVRPSS